MISIQDEYRGLLSGVFYGGLSKPDRTGTGTKAVFGRMLSHDMALGFPLLTPLSRRYLRSVRPCSIHNNSVIA